ncbi:aldose 1-epimerase [Aureococcus anophagefferens]|nr:aldose 1-epimerase [Aureococcus anophagefferens]
MKVQAGTPMTEVIKQYAELSGIDEAELDEQVALTNRDQPPVADDDDGFDCSPGRRPRGARGDAGAAGASTASFVAVSGTRQHLPMAAMTQQASYTLRHAVASSIVVTVRPLGATLSSVLAPDRNGALGEVTLGFDEGEGDAPYLDGRSAYFGCVAGRVANRTKGAAFELDGATYTLAANDGANHLHGGTVGFDKRRWTPPDPRTLRVAYAATTDKATPVNLTNHAYWNLNDGGAPPVADHEPRSTLPFYTPVGEGAIPTGEIRRAAGAMDLSAGRRLGDALYDTDGGAGYDHNYAPRRESFPPRRPRPRSPRPQALGGAVAPGGLRRAAALYAPASGRAMVVSTDQPGVQVYTGNFLDGVAGRGGTRYGRHAGLCLETQLFPDALHNAHFPSAVLRPGSTYAHATAVASTARAAL